MTKQILRLYQRKHLPGDCHLFPGPTQILGDKRFENDCVEKRFSTRLLTGRVMISSHTKTRPTIQ